MAGEGPDRTGIVVYGLFVVIDRMQNWSEIPTQILRGDRIARFRMGLWLEMVPLFYNLLVR